MNQGLHSSDDSISKFAMELLDDIEHFKNENGDEIKEIINDKATSILYVVGFGDKIFNNSLQQIQNHVSNRSTALNFLASVNFYELIKLWPGQDVYDDDKELLKKIRYAKFHAARILKSLRKGEDPNEYDPPAFEIKENEEEGEEVVDQEKSQREDEYKNLGQRKEESPAGSTKEEETDSLGLPKAPVFIDEDPKKEENTLDDEEPGFANDNEHSPSSPSPSFKLPEPPKSIPKPLVDPEPLTPREDTPVGATSSSSSQPIIKNDSGKPVTKYDVSRIIESGEVYNKAQKHAKFAISAMNYEDKGTALKELKEAIALLDQLEM